MKRVVIVCPGRGSYDRGSLGQLAGRSSDAATVIQACDAYRASMGRPTLSVLDGSERYSARQHVAGEHASLLTFGCSLADLADLSDGFEIVGVTGNSMGWYTALAAAGALSLADAITLVETMGAYQVGNVVGGQLLYPTSTPDWMPCPTRLAAVEAALAAVNAAGHAAHWSIRLGGFAVLGADADGVRALMRELPEESRGSRSFPLQLPLHSAFHTPLLRDTSARAQADLAGLRFMRPRVPLFDGRGVMHSPWSADPEELRNYTLGHQVTETYDYDAAVQSALHFTGADAVVLLGPGNSLGGPTARILVQDGWAGCRDRGAFEAHQSETPTLLSFGVPAQRAQLT